LVFLRARLYPVLDAARVIPAEVTLPFRVKGVQALDGRGQPEAAVPVRVDGNTSRFTIGPEHRTLWYEIN
jgi:hypothetical protein